MFSVRTFKTRGINIHTRLSILCSVLALMFQLYPAQQATAQQYDQYSLSMFAPFIFNPASSGVEEALMLQAGWRSQWMGYTDQAGKTVNPVSFFVAASAPIYPISSGLGVVFSRQELAYQQRTDFRLDYAYSIALNEESLLSLGISGKVSQLSLNIDNLNPIDPADPLIKETGTQKDMVPEIGTGVFYHSAKTDAGLSVMNLLGSEFETGNILLQDQMTFTIYARHRIRVMDERFRKVDLAPSLLMKTSMKSTQLDLNLLAYVNDRFWGGAGYRLQDGVILMAGAGIGNLDVGLAYDVTTSQTKEVTGKGSLEIQLRYGFPVYPPVPQSSGFNTRHL